MAYLAGGFPRFLKTPVTYDQAVDDIRWRMENRDSCFAALARRLIYDVPLSPYRKLLLWAGCEYSDLIDSVKTLGIEKTLEQLRDAGVYLTLDEFKSRIPISRPGLTLKTCESDFDNPLVVGRAYQASSSGSRGHGTRGAYDWALLAEESAHELLLYKMHDVLDAPLALWFPVPPGAAGIGNLMFNLKMGRPPEKWFSHTPTGAAMSIERRLALEFLHWAGRCSGVTVVRPDFADLAHADKVLAWLAEARRRRGAGVVRSYGSSVVRIAELALESGMDISGCVLFSGGEPLTEHRKRFIESTGAKVFPRYITVEAGLVAAACPSCSSADDMHFYKDRLALIQRAGSFLYTSLRLHTSKVMFNTEMGDRGKLTTKRCGCLFTELGFDVHMSKVRSDEKLTVEGMTLLMSELHAAISIAIEDAGGKPDSYQLWQTRDEHGLNRVVIAVNPEMKGIDETGLIRTVLHNLQRAGPGSGLASDLWRQADTFQVVREQPRMTKGHKMPGGIKLAGPR